MADRDLLSDLRTVAMKGAELVAMGFKQHDDDWRPIFFTAAADGHKLYEVGYLFQAETDEEGDRKKDAAARFLERTIRREHALAACFIASTWYAKVPVGSFSREVYERGGYRASRMANRREMLFLQLTDGERVEVWQNFIERPPGQPPRLTTWEKSSEDADRGEGRFYLLEIFKRARGM